MSTQTLPSPADLPSKLADTVPEVHELIRSRWSPRSFSDREVSDHDLRTILEAARWAASSYNEQPWRFVVAKNSPSAAFEKIFGLLLPLNQSWAKTAPLLIVMASKKTFSHDGTDNYYALHDTGAALANLFLQATALGLHGHGMAGFDRERAQKELGMPDDYQPAAVAALGYQGSPDQLEPGRFRDAETAKRVRKSFNEIVFDGSWGQPIQL